MTGLTPIAIAVFCALVALLMWPKKSTGGKALGMSNPIDSLSTLSSAVSSRLSTAPTSPRMQAIQEDCEIVASAVRTAMEKRHRDEVVALAAELLSDPAAAVEEDE